jgi:hypothetical protein
MAGSPMVFRYRFSASGLTDEAEELALIDIIEGYSSKRMDSAAVCRKLDF